jgi:hypothetical protein
MTLTSRRATNRMNGWEVLEEAIPRGEVEAIATLLGYSEDAVRRWRREPEAGDEMSTGRRSPLDAILLLINAVYTRNPQGAELIVERVMGEVTNLRRIHDQNDAMRVDEVEGELRAAIKAMSKVADEFARRKGDERL